MLNNMQAHDQSGHEKVRENRHPQATVAAKSMTRNACPIKTIQNYIINILFLIILGGEMVSQANCNQTRLVDAANMNCDMTTQSTTSSERMIQSPLHGGLTNGALHPITQPYLGDSSNFGPFYHHHGQQHHIPSYGSPYDKYKSVHHARSPNASPYDSYQSFYPQTSHHHHQIVRPNGYIDLVPR